MPHEKGQGAASSFGNNLNHSWLGAVKLAVAICIAYFLAAWLGLALQAEGVAVFWPAAGIAIGAFLKLRPSTRLRVSVGVISATVAANFMFGRNIWLATAFGFVNAGEALLTAWLIGHWFGSAFKLDDARQVLGFMVASAVGAAIGAIGGAAAVSLVGPTASPLNVWRVWFAADLLGIVTTAPLVIGLGEAVRVPPPRRELIEGGIGLTTLALLSVFVIFLPKGPWESAIPVALVFPVLLWVAVRCGPVFAAAAALVVAIAIIWSVASNVGHFGDAGIAWTNRILVAQTHGMAGALLALVLTALFAERRRSEAALKCSEAALKQGKERLQLALDGAELGAFSADFVTRRFECDARAAQIHGHDVPPRTIKESRRFIHPDDLARIHAIYAEAQRTKGVWKSEYRVQPPPNHLHAGETRWIAAEGSIVCDPQGSPLGVFGVTRDITERKKAEAALRQSETRLAGQRKALELALNGEPLAMSLGVLVRTAIDQLGEGVRAAFYLANRAHTGLHHVVGMSAAYAEAVDGFEIGPASLSCGLATHTGLPILTSDVTKEPRWKPWLWLAEKFDYRGCWSFPVRTEAGRFVGTLAIYWRRPREATPRELELAAVLTATAAIIIARHTDAEQRDRAQAALRESEERLRESNAQLALAGRAALVGSYVYNVNKGTMQISDGYATIHGLPDGITETTIREWRSRVHPEDLARAEGLREQAFVERRKEDNAEYRIILSTGEIRWIERRGAISFGEDGRPERVVGVNIDVTERKRAEQHQHALNAELDHRVKNVLATVSAIIAQTQESSHSRAEFATGLNNRIKSLARTHELLSERNWRGAPLAEIVQREFAPYTTGNTVSRGPSVILKAEAAPAVSTVLHELVTNAAKYGALSNRNGRVLVQWRWLQNGRHDRLLIEWQESGGPPVLAPSRSGYGTTIIRELIPFEFGGEVELSFASGGTRCRLEIPGEWANRNC